ncbi:hypothetical protein GBAR_LOCUS6547 [Geodia barretti]|uniref:Uncharacterized protein n=1 Tax=Geodia barretti TaxID=519541 RepID=A0AA35W6D4_GEOBA|nr:hypothetical protein GBAR_LOCUS6547 [Geodia barretti]
MQCVNTWPIVRLTSVRVAQLFMLLMSLAMLELVSCEEGSGGSGCSDAVNQMLPLSSPDPNSQQISGLFLSSLGPCGGGGCVSGWSYCYYSPYGNEESLVTVIFSLWRWSEGGTLKEVNGSKFSVDMKTLPEGQWLVCEDRDLGEGCGVEMEEDDLVGVFINQNTSLHILGEVDGGRVMVGSVENGERGSVSNISLALKRDTSLLVTPTFNDLSFCSDAAQEECSGDPTSTPTRDPPRDEEVASPAEGIPGLELLVVSAGLSLIVLVLLTLLCFFLCFLRRKSRSMKRGTISTVVLNSHRQHSDVGTEHDVEMHILDTGSSTHSTSLSPTPNGTARVWQVDHRKTPPPVNQNPDTSPPGKLPSRKSEFKLHPFLQRVWSLPRNPPTTPLC